MNNIIINKLSKIVLILSLFLFLGIGNISAQTVNNLILNPSVETPNGTKPSNWSIGKWGTNTATFSYTDGGYNGTKSVSVNMTTYTSGDAKWFFDDVKVTPGKKYVFSEYYKTNTSATNVTIRWKKTDGTYIYQSLGNPSISSSNWMLRTSTFTVPANVVSMTVFHVIRGVGNLQLDNFSLTDATQVVTQTAPQTTTATTTNQTLSTGTKPITSTTTSNQVVSTTTTLVQSGSTSSGLNFPKKEWGVYTGWAETALDSFETLVGKQAQYRAVFIHWGNENAFPTYLAPYVKDKGKTLVIFWEATNYNNTSVNQQTYSYDNINSGAWDAYFAQFAQAAKQYGGQVIIIPFSEMNGNWFPWAITVNGNSADKHISAYRRIRDFFRDAPNVKFGWAPNNDSLPDTAANKFENFYPGDNYVDYVGLDGFNFDLPWMSFDQVFGSAINRIKVYKKPIFIFSFASAQGSQKSAWITDALTIQIPKYPEIKGWIWFNESKERDWRVNSDLNSLSAFKTALP